MHTELASYGGIFTLLTVTGRLTDLDNSLQSILFCDLIVLDMIVEENI